MDYFLFLPSDAFISATGVSRSGFRLWIDITRSGSRCNRSLLSRNTMSASEVLIEAMSRMAAIFHCHQLETQILIGIQRAQTE
jgi:hypothetical protein